MVTPHIMSGFFEELQRRKVYRVAAAYIVAAGFLIQIASAAFPAWELPNWSLRLVITMLLIGFPIALIFAWAFDVTPQGIEVTPKVAGAHRRRNLILLIAGGVIASLAAGFFLLPRASARKIDKSIAVLPFQNLSDEKENAYFADGMQDDILTNLSKIGDLKVISRKKSLPLSRRGFRQMRKRVSINGQPKIRTPICFSSRHTITLIEWTCFTTCRSRLSRFLSKRSSSIQTLPRRLPVSPWSRAGSITAWIPYRADGRKRVPTRRRRCDGNSPFP